MSASSRSINLAVIPGDGIGQEVVAQGLKVLNAVLPQDVKLQTTEFDFGAKRYHATGETLTDADAEALKQHDAILLGAIGDPSVPSGVLERGFLLKLRFLFDHHVNLRPSKLLPGVVTPLAGQPEIDFIVVREGTEVSIDQWRTDSENGTLTEVFACGTAAVITPVGTVKCNAGEWQQSGGEPGKVTMALRDALLNIQRGTAEDVHGWMHDLA
ncbi:3-isopropylmalate dehydrogenase [Streptomyces alboniger]